MTTGSTSFLRNLPTAEKEELLKLNSLEELPKSRYATKLAVTAYPNTRRGRKAVFSHVEVYKMVENVAGKMREAGVRPGTVCAFALPTSCESLIYFYALMWIAAVAAPIDPDLEPEAFEDALRRTGAKVLVSPYVDDEDDQLQQKCANASKNLQLIEWHIHRTTNEGVVLVTHSRVMGSGAAWAGGAGDFKLDPEEIAVHVSSDVGIVPLTHRALCAASKSFVTTYDLAVNMSTMLAPPLHDIHGILILIAAIYSGGHIVLPGYGGFEAEKFWDLAKKHDIKWVSASSDQILDLYEERTKKQDPKAQQLTFVRSSGQTCITAELIEKVESCLKTPVYESYGTPEACGFATTNREGKAIPGTVGTPVDGIEIAVFDVDTREVCNPGTVGEIAVSGTHAASYYLDSEKATEIASFTTEVNGVTQTWFATGDRGAIDDKGYLNVHGSSRTLRAAEIAIQEKKARELEAIAIAKAETDRVEAEKRAVEEEKRKEEERIAEEKRLEEERMEEERRMKEEEDRKKRIEEEEAERQMKEEEEKERQLRQEQEIAEREREIDARTAERVAALARVGVQNPQDLDEETANAILARLAAIEENHRRLQEDFEGRTAAELEAMRLRVAEAEAEAERLAEGTGGGKVVDVRMEELEAAVMAAAASAESSANNTREAVKAAKEVADAAYGTNQSQPVELKASTGDQGALTKTVRVPLDEVDSAMKSHPAVEVAKAFGRKDKRFGAEVFCVIVPKKGARVSEAWLKLHAQSILPAPMVPKKFYYMNQMPTDITRRKLSESSMLQDLSSFPGFMDVTHKKGSQWKQKQPKRRVGA